MSFRDDHDAALMRADAAERERALLQMEVQHLEIQLTRAREWLGGPSKRAFLVGGLIVFGIGLALVGFLLGRMTVEPTLDAPRARANAAPLRPTVTGVIVADGPRVGHWTLAATRCAQRSDGIELTSIGDGGVSFWLSNNQIELETRAGTLYLDHKLCVSKMIGVVARTDDRIDGHLELDCQFEGNWLQGRIDFQHCR